MVQRTGNQDKVNHFTHIYFLGIGGLSKKALQNNAVADLTKNAGLTGSQALVNITVKASVAEYIFVTKVTYYAEATVIEFDK